MTQTPVPQRMGYPDYPFQSHYLAVDRFRLHFLDEGASNAEPIVMLHGNPSWSFYFRKMILALRKQYRCIVPDHIGMGLSDKPKGSSYPFTLDQRVNDLEHLLNHLKIKQNLTLIIHDWGGMIGMAYALRHPEKIKRLVVFNTCNNRYLDEI